MENILFNIGIALLVVMIIVWFNLPQGLKQIKVVVYSPKTGYIWSVCVMEQNAETIAYIDDYRAMGYSVEVQPA